MIIEILGLSIHAREDFMKRSIILLFLMAFFVSCNDKKTVKQKHRAQRHQATQKDIIVYGYRIPNTTLNFHYIGKELRNIKGIEKLICIENMSLSSNPISDISLISNLRTLRYLDIRRTYVTNIEPLAALEKLQYLNLKFTFVTNILPLPRSLTNLFIDNDISSEMLKKFKKSHPRCAVRFDDGFPDKKFKKKGPYLN
jgi:hypothetical protein